MDTLALAAGAAALGALHALDADHIMAVTVLAAGAGRRRALRYALRWALGHALALTALALPVLWLGRALPERLAAAAETAVGLTLIALGAATLWALWRGRVHLHRHRHDALPEHAHWHRHAPGEDHDRRAHRHRHTPTLVGLLHGTAGSAPLLALLPMSLQASPAAALLYLLAFSLGVALAMAAFGGALGDAWRRLPLHWAARLRALVGAAAIGLGSHWLLA
ncbi:MAG: hypothetical protein KatS3mg121_0592 [Gammaproteobacteria bacterium]|nr:MAG: hypothetical protein KatS3mg121_0592 [Gammaproteobacteria bacterium]